RGIKHLQKRTIRQWADITLNAGQPFNRIVKVSETRLHLSRYDLILKSKVAAGTRQRRTGVELTSHCILLLRKLGLVRCCGSPRQRVVYHPAEQNIAIKIDKGNRFPPHCNLQTGLDFFFGEKGLLSVEAISAHDRKFARPIAP